MDLAGELDAQELVVCSLAFTIPEPQPSTTATPATCRVVNVLSRHRHLSGGQRSNNTKATAKTKLPVDISRR